MKYTSNDEVTTLIFDLGNVIVDLDGDRVLDGFARFTTADKAELLQLIVGNRDLFAYETGKISSMEFIDSVRKSLKMDITDAEFETIWNSMLVNIPIEKLELLEACSKNHQTMIMSNTNAMHEQAFDKMVFDLTEGKKMSDFVETAYYSHTMGLRKPDVEVFQQIVDTHGLVPSEVVFFDDKRENIEASEQIGIQGVLLADPKDLFSYFI